MIGTDTARMFPSFHLMGGRGGEGGKKREDRLPGPIGRLIKNVAIVEDELMVAWSLESMIEDLGLAVVGIFANGEAAIAALQNVDVDLVCMDINLGRGMDGIEAARRIWERQPTPILFISAYTDEPTRARIGAIGPGAALLGKPTSLATLEQAISDFSRTLS
jgi:DNA-binding NarL/FixJ family response regulator